MGPQDILPTYDRVAEQYARERSKTLFERPWLDRMLNVAPPPRRILDLGCGPGVPIARYLLDRRAQVTGVDGAEAMVDLYRQNVPSAQVVLADMRGLRMGQSFDGLLAWNSFFHLDQAEQRAMFPVLAAHAHAGTALMFTSGHVSGEVMGMAGGAPVYHSSLDADEYRALLTMNGFEVLHYAPEDPDTQGHTIWLARFTGTVA